MTDIRSNKLRFLTAVIMAISLMAAPALQAATVYTQAVNSVTEFKCCCYPAEKQKNSCLTKEIVLEDDCACTIELSAPLIPPPFMADIQTKYELKQNINISELSIDNSLSDEPALVLSDKLILSINSPPLYISNSAFLI